MYKGVLFCPYSWKLLDILTEIWVNRFFLTKFTTFLTENYKNNKITVKLQTTHLKLKINMTTVFTQIIHSFHTVFTNTTHTLTTSWPQFDDKLCGSLQKNAGDDARSAQKHVFTNTTHTLTNFLTTVAPLFDNSFDTGWWQAHADRNFVYPFKKTRVAREVSLKKGGCRAKRVEARTNHFSETSQNNPNLIYFENFLTRLPIFKYLYGHCFILHSFHFIFNAFFCFFTRFFGNRVKFGI
jgi:hypothetical protein